MRASEKIGLNRLQAMFTEIFGFGRAAAFTAALLTAVIVVLAVYWFIHLAPPRTITLITGPQGSMFETNAGKYRKILARNGVDLKIVPSQGSLENLKRLADPSADVDIGFVQGGLTKGMNINTLTSLGSLYNQPLLVFYRAARPVELLSELNGKRLATGPEGSGTRALALALLAANGIQPGGATVFDDQDAEDAADALLLGRVDAVFLSGDSAPLPIIQKLMRAPGIRIFHFTQAIGYTRRIPYLSKMELPQGSIDFGKNIPARDVYLVGPTVELIARSDLHPALSDLLLEAASEIHGRASLFRRQGEFPAPLEHEFPISPEAQRYYKSGKSFLYRYFPFWLASIVNRILVVFVPMVVVMIPLLKAVPAAYQWRVRLGIYRWYRALLALERDVTEQFREDQRENFLERLDHVEKAVNKMRVPASFADRFYELRAHISLVRIRLMSGK